MKAIAGTSRLTVYAVMAAGLVATLPFVAWGAGGSESHALAFLFIALLLLAAKASSLIERLGQPAVLGELLVGVLLGNLALFGITFFEQIKSDEIIIFLAQLGVVILLFQIGLESNIKEMTKVGLPAFLVAIAGVVVPFGLGVYIVGPLLLPEADTVTLLFLGAALTATSVGITARVFKDLGKLQTRESQIVLGAAVIDDVMGLIILAVVSAIAKAGSIAGSEVAEIIFRAVLFLGAAIVLGRLLAPSISLYFSKIHTGVGMKFTLAFAIGLLFAWAAAKIGLAPIIGAFAGGLILDAVVFRRFRRPDFVEELDEIQAELPAPAKGKVAKIIDHYEHRHVEDLIEPVAQVFVPVFFVFTGMSVDLTTFADKTVILTALGITAVAFVGKIVAGLFAGKGVNKWIVGFGMVPRGEVGLIFATIGAGLGVITGGTFSVIIIMVILTTLMTPPILTYLLKKQG